MPAAESAACSEKDMSKAIVPRCGGTCRAALHGLCPPRVRIEQAQPTSAPCLFFFFFFAKAVVEMRRCAAIRLRRGGLFREVLVPDIDDDQRVGWQLHHTLASVREVRSHSRSRTLKAGAPLPLGISQ